MSDTQRDRLEALDDGLDIDLDNPVNLGHDLNRGRVAWWLTVPGLEGGKTWSDLIGLNHGTLTGLSTSSGWRSTMRPGGWGSIAFADTGAGAVAAAVPAALKLGLPVTWGCWLRAVGSPDNNSTIFGLAPNNTGSSPFASYYLYSDITGKLTVGLNSAGTFAGINSTKSTSALTAWTRAVAVLTATDLRIYINGSLDTTSTASRSDPTYGATAQLFAGNEAGKSANSTVEIDDGFVIAGAWSAANAFADYDLSSRGYPGVLNRY